METAATSAMIATKDSMSMPPYPIMRVCDSFSTSFGVVPEAIIAWNPDRAPQAMVTKRKGNSAPVNTGPSVREANSEIAGVSIIGRTSTIAAASMTMVPIFTKVER